MGSCGAGVGLERGEVGRWVRREVVVGVVSEDTG